MVQAPICRTYWKMFSGVSYDKSKQATKFKEVRTGNKCVGVRASVPRRRPLIKSSDVTSTLQTYTTSILKSDNVVVSNEHTCVPLHNRFNILSNIDVWEWNTKDINKKVDTNVDFVNKIKQVNDVNTSKVCDIKNRQLTDKNKWQGKIKHSQNVNSTARYQGDMVLLVENNDKYDLELKPRHRQRIADAKINKTF